MRSLIHFCFMTWLSNLMSAFEYRTSFFVQIVGMLLNNAMYLAFWLIFFGRVGSIGGTGFRDILLNYALVTTAFGLNAIFFGNTRRVSLLITEGGLDHFLRTPKPVLLHVLIVRSSTSAFADVLFGLICFAMSGYTKLDQIVSFLAVIPLAMAVMLGFDILLQSLAFWLGNIRILALNVTQAALTFSFYPIHLFDWKAQLILFTFIPAAYFSTVPGMVVKAQDLRSFLLLAGVAGFALFFGAAVFYRGLRRYESSSTMGAIS